MSGTAAAPVAAFGIGEAVRFGWERFKANIPTLALVALAFWALQAVVTWVGRDATGLARAVIQFLGFLVGILVSMGWVRVSLDLTDGREVSAADLVPSPDRFLAYAVASILYGLLVAFGLVLLIVPGVILGLVYLFHGYVVVDRGDGAIEALKRSADITRGHRSELFVFVLALIGFNLLGLLALGVGVLITSPVSLIATGYVYRRLAGGPVAA